MHVVSRLWNSVPVTQNLLWFEFMISYQCAIGLGKNFYQTFHVPAFEFDWLGHWRSDAGKCEIEPLNIPLVSDLLDMLVMYDKSCALRYNRQTFFSQNWYWFYVVVDYINHVAIVLFFWIFHNNNSMSRRFSRNQQYEHRVDSNIEY